MSDLVHHRAAGDGAHRTAQAQAQRYVYVARSRRAGGLSLGIDLSPLGYCSFACLYCQASHPALRQLDMHVGISQLRDELAAALSQPHAVDLRDLVLAGSGEPARADNFAEALNCIQDCCSQAGFTRPRRIFTNGRHFSEQPVRDALATWSRGGGEIWVKLDAVSTEQMTGINGVSIDVAAHLAEIWRLAQTTPIGIQTMLVRGGTLAEPATIAHGVAECIASALAQGAKITGIHLLTLSRAPADTHYAALLKPIDAAELQRLAQLLRQHTGLTVHAFPAAAEDRE